MEPLIPLARAIAVEAARLGIPVTVKVDRDRGAVVIEGSALMNWGSRTRLESTLTQHRIQHDTHMPRAYIVAYPTPSASQ